MSLTKRHLESLPEDEQNKILGAVHVFADDADGIDPDYEAWWSEREACEDAAWNTIAPPTGPDDYPDYGDLPF